MMPPLSSLSVASRPMPPSMTPEMSPTVSHGGDDEHDHDGQDGAEVEDDLDRHQLGDGEPAGLSDLVPVQHPCLVNSTPSAVTPVVGRTKPMTMAAR